ncbi:MAG: hypothetical protein J5744_00980 [Oscillospiraceae bacterium]|nr:hypothetical protein [Oscillospiraceae bacterium]
MYMGRAQSEKKPFYVTVTALHYIGGACCPQVIALPSGPAVMIEDVKKVQKLSGKDNDGAEERYLVNLKGKERYLYRKGQRWFIYPQKEDQKLFGVVPNEFL